MCGAEATANINNCTFTNNNFGVVGVETGIINSKNSQYDENFQVAIFIKDQAKGTFENNEISNGKQFGIAVRSEEPIVFRSNVFKKQWNKLVDPV